MVSGAYVHVMDVRAVRRPSYIQPAPETTQFTHLDILPDDAGVVVQGLVGAVLVEAEAGRGAVVARGEHAGEYGCADFI